MTPLVVYGASGHGRETLTWARDAGHDVLGYVDDDAAAHGTERTGATVLGGLDWIVSRVAEGPLAVALGVADPDTKQRLAEKLWTLGVSFPAIVHPSAVVAPTAAIREGVVIAPHSVISVDVVLADCVTVNYGATIGHDARLEPYATVLPGANVSGNVVVGTGATVGTGSAVRQGLRIGAGAFVGAGATVVTDVAPGVTVVGTPARPPA